MSASLANRVVLVTGASSGIGAAVAVGRIGNVLAVYVADAALSRGIPQYFLTWAITMTLVLISLALVRRHIAPTAPAPMYAAAPARH